VLFDESVWLNFEEFLWGYVCSTMCFGVFVCFWWSFCIVLGGVSVDMCKCKYENVW
jgi:hypothetical protein